ncbi:glycosyltransferase family 4 protein [Candidatus Dojkabacteria bacterium]|uniref:Glycosyltransferase family 4 protein n=1 Tax=Candidatus Dojkabacteria bacterium TaxID=2099670 RepID=A0A955I8H9_9BACT|nr:glycosyltransferase family 4 protein [Candidatus Dojkabacteria bacterium]
MLTTYYHPHISGLTLYFQRLAEEYVKLGHDVTILCAQHDKSLKSTEVIMGVKVIRTPYLVKINKGMVLPKIIFDAWKPLRKADVLHNNLPSIEALPVVILAKLLRVPVVTTYVCDITLPRFFGSKLIDKIIDINHHLVLKLSDTIASFTIDFAKHSRVLKNYYKRTLEVLPIVELDKKNILKIDELEKSPHPRIGMATRIAADKGIDYMINALPNIWKKFPTAQLFLVGTINAVGEERYLEKLQPLFDKYKDKIHLLGQVSPDSMPYYFKNIDVLVVASTNSTEAFGMVQVEAMLEGTPVVATDLPGVRVPIHTTGMGEIAKIADSEDLANRIINVLNKKKVYPKDALAKFKKQNVIKTNLKMYNDLLENH